MIVHGYIQDIDAQSITIVAPLTCPELIVKRQVTECEVRLDDGRTISSSQRNKIFALIRDITRFTSGFTDKQAYLNETLRQMQLSFLIERSDSEEVRYQLTYHYCQLTGIDMFSLSDVDMTTAREFISYLIELCVKHGIPCSDTLLNRCEDVEGYIYTCLKYKKCCITGERAQLHHVDAVGRGRNRKDIVHKGMRVLPLCAKMHNKAHDMGRDSFCKMYHLVPVVLDDELCEIYGLKAQ